jgi:hypothetical protein
MASYGSGGRKTEHPNREKHLSISTIAVRTPGATALRSLPFGLTRAIMGHLVSGTDADQAYAWNVAIALISAPDDSDRTVARSEARDH